MLVLKMPFAGFQSKELELNFDSWFNATFGGSKSSIEYNTGDNIERYMHVAWGNANSIIVTTCNTRGRS